MNITYRDITKGKNPNRNSLNLCLPLPPHDLSPNARCHWAAKARAIKKYRMYAWAEAVSRNGGIGDRWRDATCQATFYFCDNRSRDRDNLLAALKSAFDGLTDAHIIEDDAGLVHLPVRVERDRENPRVELEITRAGPSRNKNH